MPSSVWRPVGALLLDLAAWCVLPAAFLGFYIGHYFQPVAAALPHLRLVLVLYAALALLRLLLWRFARPVVARFGATLAASALLASMLAYYGLVLVGLQYWGRVISWDLIQSYADQAPSLAE